jgi:hypothetical protein
VRALSGKQELLERGAFAAYEAVLATHAAAVRPGEVSCVLAMNGFEVLRWSFRGAPARGAAGRLPAAAAGHGPSAPDTHRRFGQTHRLKCL